MTNPKITTLFCDIGGVLLTNGWGHESRAKAAAEFKFDLKEFNDRHQLIFGDYEVGKITLSDYLRYTVFFEARAFSEKAFKEFMYAQSQPDEAMLALMREYKQRYGLKVVMLSNEGRELTEHRIKTFKLDTLADFFMMSCFAGIRKPDRQIYHMAINMSQTHPSKIVYLDDRQLFVEIGRDLGLHSIQQKSVATTRAALEELFAK